MHYERLPQEQSPREQFPNICASEDGRWIAGGFSGQPYDSVALWDAHTGRLLFEQPLRARLTAVELDVATRTLAAEHLTDALQTSVALFDIGTGKWRATVTPRTEIYTGVSPCFTADRRLLIQTKTQLEWWEPHTGRFLMERRVPLAGHGYLLSTQSCGRCFRIAEYINTDPQFGIDLKETRSSLEVLSEKDGSPQGVLLRNHPQLVRYMTHPTAEVVALMLGDSSSGFSLQVYQVPTLRLLAKRAFPSIVAGVCEDSLRFSRDGSLLYLGNVHPRVWHWQRDSVREAYPNEVRTFSTFYLGDREVYHQSWDGAIRDARNDRFLLRLRSRK